KIISGLPTVREQWAHTLVSRGVVSETQAAEMVSRHQRDLEQALETVQRDAQPREQYPEPPPRGVARQAKTAVPFERLQALNADLTRVPAGFTIHKKLERGREKRRAAVNALDEPTIDWAAAEDLAF